MLAKSVVLARHEREVATVFDTTEPLAREAMSRAAHKLPIKSKFITRAGAGGME